MFYVLEMNDSFASIVLCDMTCSRYGKDELREDILMKIIEKSRAVVEAVVAVAVAVAVVAVAVAIVAGFAAVIRREKAAADRVAAAATRHVLAHLIETY